MTLFIQYSSLSTINSFKINEKDFTFLDVGVMLRDVEDLTYNFIINNFDFPLFFVISTLLLDDKDIDKVKLNQIQFEISDKKDDYMILKIMSDCQLKLITNYCDRLACNGLGSFMFEGEDIQIRELSPVEHWSKPTEFPKLDWGKVSTLINIEEVGFTLITINERINSTLKLLNNIPKGYDIDLENSDIVQDS